MYIIYICIPQIRSLLFWILFMSLNFITRSFCVHIIVKDCPREKNPTRDNYGISVKPREKNDFIIYRYETA